jgi:CheY-like chemotaxis protein
VLIVDDDDSIRESLATLLEEEGYGVLLASNGKDALALLQRVDEPLVVLLDWMMPEMTGQDVLQMVLREPAGLYRHAYLVLSAAVTAREQVARFAESLGVRVFTKPFEIDELLEAVAHAAAALTSLQHNQWSALDQAAG